MIQIGLVVFREILEIVLLLILIHTANSSRVKNFHYYLLSGSLTGIIGASALAFATAYLGGLLDGLGREVFNSCIMFLTAGMLASTVIYMRNYSERVKSEAYHLIDKASKSVLYKIVLIALIAATIFREGVEILLFMCSIVIANQLPLADCFTGLAIGALAAVIFSFLFYKGLVKVASFFHISSFFIVLIAASLVSEGIGILNRSGAMNILSKNAWDSSWLIPDESFVGKALSILFGYSAKPSILEAMTFVMTFAVIIYFNQKIILNNKK